MEIILSGGGSGDQTIELDKKFANLVDKSKPLLYIPIAIETKNHPYSECLRWLKSTLDLFGIKKYEMWTERELYKSKTIKPKKFGGIYIGGGNTFYLLKTFKDNSFWKFLIEAIKNNIPIYGGSAGAIIFGESIMSSYDENFVNLKDFSGMDLLNGISIFCHYKPEKEDNVYERLININSKKIIALTEETGIYLNNNKAVIIGKKSAHLFSINNKKEINVGQSIS